MNPHGGLLHRVRLLARRFGIDLSRYPGMDPMHMLVRLLNSRDVNVVLDVGANSGRYATELRRAGYTKRITSFEPLREPFELLARDAAEDDLWDAYPYALGDEDGSVVMHVAANAGESSSVLPMLQAHVDAYPGASYVGEQEAPLRSLDSLAAELLSPDDRIFLKADVQGYERAVIGGARETLSRCVGMQLELSLVPLYEGGMLYREAIDTAGRLGFVLMGLVPGFADLRNGRLLQADGIFMREFATDESSDHDGSAQRFGQTNGRVATANVQHRPIE
jgi:FkbM family methyltransferase